MLIGIFSVISLALAALVCRTVGAFADFSWLWVLPLGFAASCLMLVILWFVMIIIMAQAVDMKKTQDKDSPFYRAVINLSVAAVVKLMGIDIQTRGTEQLPKDGRFLLVCNHLHDTDSVVLMQVFKKTKIAFISKRENDIKFIIGPFLRKILCQPINRENDREALKTILNCVRLIEEDVVSIGVFPEGYIWHDRLLRPFRGGVFKIAQKANVPVVVCTLQNTQYLYANMSKLKPTQVHVHLVGVIPAEELKGRPALDIAKQAYEMMVQDLGPDLVAPVEDVENSCKKQGI